jgi:ubiquinone/menaquinone biosynthesis C-methylase UbiE
MSEPAYISDSTSRFWDRMANFYSKQPVPDESVYQKKLEITQEYLRSDMSVVEFGCGTGSTAIAHGPHVGHIRAVDVSSKMIEIARAKAHEAGATNVDFEQSTIGAFSAPEESLDVVLGLSILHLLEDKQAAIAKIYRLLKPGGLFVSSTACLGDTRIKYLKLAISLGRILGLLPRVAFFTKQELNDAMLQSGFAMDYEWQPGKGKAVFIVAKKH